MDATIGEQHAALNATRKVLVEADWDFTLFQNITIKDAPSKNTLAFAERSKLRQFPENAVGTHCGRDLHDRLNSGQKRQPPG